MEYRKIIFTYITDVEEYADVVYLLWDYLGTLYKNGQILKQYELVKQGKQYIAYVTVPEKDALEEKNYNHYSIVALGKLEEIFTITEEVEGENLGCNKTCQCENSSCYMLYSDFCLQESPIICWDCGKSVPLYRLPFISNEKEHYQIVSWQQAYNSVDQLWMNSLADRFTYHQLTNPESQLAREGREICSDLEKVLHKPVYYYLFHEHKPLGNCPNCGKPWKPSGHKEVVGYKCEDCRLAINESSKFFDGPTYTELEGTAKL